MQEHDEGTPEGSEAAQISAGQAREVTRLLADARLSEPMPDEVAARLDDVLATLAAERRAGAAPVVDLAARRRTRRVRLLVAAAAVVAAGVALPGYLGAMTTSSDDASTAGQAASDERASDGVELGDGAGSGSSADEDRAEAPRPSDDGERPAEDGLDAALGYWSAVQIRPEHFAADVARMTLDVTASSQESYSTTRNQLEALKDLSAGAARCVPGDGVGRLYRASYDGRRGFLLVGPRVDERRRYDLFVCGEPEVTRSVILPAD